MASNPTSVVLGGSAFTAVDVVCTALSTLFFIFVFLTLASFVMPGFWAFELLFSLRLYIAAAGAAGAFAGLAARKPALVAIAALCAVLNFAPVAMATLRAAPADRLGPGAKTILWMNTEYNHETYRALLKKAAAMGAEAVVAAEAPWTWEKVGGDLLDPFPCRAIDANGRLVLILSRPPCGATRPAPAEKSAIAAQWLEAPDGVRLVGVHAWNLSAPLTRPPRHALLSRMVDQNRQRRAMIDDAATRAQSAPASILVGDFNAVPWSNVFHSTAMKDLRRRRCGSIVAWTWSSGLGLVKLPIDHVLASDNIRLACRIGDIEGSDHRPLIIRYERTQPAGVPAGDG